MKGRRYFAYGLRLLADDEIAGLTPCFDADEPDVSIHLNHLPPQYLGEPRTCWYRSQVLATGC